ncbi:hypothetical protein [Bordetella parapertussis]|uniref:hypothetical protein n=1 Tax=Bordetella parapertussis TaxID=519 RepID=UPI0003182942|nr:hypothetical protein [Bordetella parapertussis]
MMLGTLRRDPAWLTVAVLAVGLLGVFLVWPLVSMLAKSFVAADGSVGLAGYIRFFSEPAYREVFVNTLILGVAVTATRCWWAAAWPWWWRAAAFRWPAWSPPCRW